MRDGGFALEEPFGDDPAHAAERDALIAFLCGSGRHGSRRGGFRSGGSRSLGGFHVLGHNATSRASAAERTQIDAFFRGDFFGQRRGFHPFAGPGWRRGGRGRGRGRRFRAGGFRGRRGSG